MASNAHVGLLPLRYLLYARNSGVSRVHISIQLGVRHIEVVDRSKLVRIVSIFAAADKSFFETDVRLTPGLDDLGALGDQGAYCLRGVTWAFGSYTRP